MSPPNPVLRFFGRDLYLYRKSLLKLPAYVGYFARLWILFQRPWTFLMAYLKMQSPPGNRVITRQGLQIGFSSHPHDIITIFAVMVRQDYGKVRPGSIVLDIGANIGTFCLYAARAGAKRIYAFEPNVEAYNCLIENVAVNGLAERIIPRRLAVTDSDNGRVAFPVQASMYNAILRGEANTPFDEVVTVRLSSIVDEVGSIDLLKLDCEGAEYDILYNTDLRTFKMIREVRLEYHTGRLAELTAFLEHNGYHLLRVEEDTYLSGNIWCRRS